MVIMNKRDGLFFLVLLVMRITYGTRFKNLLFLPMKSDNVSTTEAGALPMVDARIACPNLPREGRNAHELLHGQKHVCPK